MRATEREIAALAANATLVSTYWMSWQRVVGMQRAAGIDAGEVSLDHAAYHVLALVAPFLVGDGRALIERLGEDYLYSAARGASDGEEVGEVSARRQGIRRTTRRASRKTGRACTRATASRFPKDADVLEAWRHFHAGDFAQAVEAGQSAGGAGVNAAVKAQIGLRQLSREVRQGEDRRCSKRRPRSADARRREAPKDANAHYLYAFALGRYSQGISVAKALAQGFGGKIKEAI